MKTIELKAIIRNGYEDDNLSIDLINDLIYDENKLDEFLESEENPYSKILFSLLYMQKNEDEAKVIWENILKNLKNLEDNLDRKVGASVAAMDYFQNIVEKDIDLKIVNEDNFDLITDIAIKDDLTELYNRDVLNVFLEKIFESSFRDNKTFCFVMLDIDNFKIINDVHGHQIGDEILKNISKIILSNIRKMDIAFRYGGDEMSIIFPNANKYQAFKIMENIRVEIRKYYEEDLEVTVSVGISENTKFLEFEEIIENADKKLYEAKKRGRNKTEY